MGGFFAHTSFGQVDFTHILQIGEVLVLLQTTLARKEYFLKYVSDSDEGGQKAKVCKETYVIRYEIPLSYNSG